MSKVYFTDFRTSLNENVPQKLLRLIKKAGIEDIDFNKKFVAIKIHFGEPGNLAFLRPNFAKVVADEVKALGGNPFLTDCNTLYVGRRKNALEHLESAQENGFSPLSTGCQMIIADGLKGTDEIYVKISGENIKHIKEAKIGTAVMDADIVISLNHFKGHESAGFGGAIKNIGMGCGSRAGKMEMHYSGKPVVKTKYCVRCRMCFKNCAFGAISFPAPEKKAEINQDKCVGCGRCIGSCNFDAISPKNGSSNLLLNEKMAEYSLAVLQNRPSFHINIINNVSPYCDCHAENDAAIVSDIGMLASFDPVALDMACADLVNKATPIPNSALGESKRDLHDHFKNIFPDTDWMSCLTHAEKIGVGEIKYELVQI